MATEPGGVSDYCRRIEGYLCQKNDGHLIRIAGPSFDVVSRWASTGVPLKVAFSGIDRYFERYYRAGPRRRPVKIDFCEADVLDVFDEWRRAVGLTAAAAGTEDPSLHEPDASRSRRRGSLPEHLERVLTKLSSLCATGVLTDAVDPLLDRVSSELDAARSNSGGLRGNARRAAIARLVDLDEQLMRIASTLLPPPVLDSIRREAMTELAVYRQSMSEDAFEGAVERAVSHGIRARLALPTITFD